MFSKQAMGSSFMVLQAVLVNACFAILRTMSESGWPQSTMYSASSALSTVAIIVGILVSGTPFPQRSDRKWVVLAGSFWASSFCLVVFAVLLKTPLGDIAALTSVNVVVAAFLGRAFLGEPLRWVHIFAVMCSLGGALLISRPSVLFGQGSTSVPVAGFILPVLGGIFDASILICGRKSADTSSWFHALSTQVQSCIVFFVLPFTPFVAKMDFRPVLDRPLEAAGWIAALFFLDTLNIITYCTAAQWCPAAMAATVNNAALMVVGYAAQILLFGTPVETISIVGAGLMLVGVVSMSMVREASPLRVIDSGAEASTSNAAPIADDENESIASFVASEFVDEEPRARRRSAGSGKPSDLEPHMAAGPIGRTVGI